MTTETGAPASDQSVAPVELPEEISLEDAGNIINSWSDGDLKRNQNIEGEEPPEAESAKPPATAKKEPPKEETVDPETDPDEETETAETEDDNLPAIDRPRSWAKELDEEWASYPRAAQERIAKREQERDSAIRRGQNEIAEQRTAMEAERKAMEALKQQYEEKLPSLVRNLEDALQNEFGDIRSMADVRKLQTEDPFRFQQWQLRQMELSAAQQEKQTSDQKRNEEIQNRWNSHVQEEGKRFIEALSDKDRDNLKELMAEAPKFLEDRGFKNQELADLWQGKDKLSLHDHRVQLLILDGMKFRTLQNAPKAVAARPMAPVQKPGVARVNGDDTEIRTLTKRLEQTGTEDDGWALLEARLKGRSRRAA